MISAVGNSLVFRFDAEEVFVEPWGENALRVRSTKENQLPKDNWALNDQQKSVKPVIEIKDNRGSILNGKIRASVSQHGKIMIFNSEGKLLLEEYSRNRLDLLDPKCSATEVEAREFRPTPAGDYHLTLRFESLDKDEKLYGMGQYQQPHLNLKGMDLEMAHRNSQASVPFALSSRGYGILWNNPAIGRAVFGKNITSFEAYSTKALDYWVVAGDSPAEIVEAYGSATGKVPMMPEYGLGFWQCKLRYQTQDELLQVAREYKRRELPIDVIVVDFFHWPTQGDWKFDTNFWPDPDAMIRELQDMKIELMVSIWPTVERSSENYKEMLEHGYLIRTERGFRVGLDFEGPTIHIDATNPNARKFLWGKVHSNYYSKGIKVFWLDEAEPEYTVYDFDNYRYWRGTNLSIGNIYPVEYSRAFYEGMEAAGQKDIVNLVRCAWAGSQKFGALVWSGDIASSWSSFRNQLSAGLNMGLAGLPWWTTDIGGFHGGDPNNDAFRELFVRWFQWGTFCPVMRLHGDREPRQPQLGKGGGATCRSGAENEVWSYGEEVFGICKKYMLLREELRDYTRSLMKAAHEFGSPIMRPCFYDFPDDAKCWEIEAQYMYGPKYLCCPVLEAGILSMEIYFPAGTQWKLLGGEIVYEGGKTGKVACPIDIMPVFVRQGYE